MSKQPNILFITTHDTGRHFHCCGVPTVQSPSIDRLARQGVRCTRMFSAGTICSPSRAAMMTGRWPQSNGVLGLTHTPWLWRYRDGERHLSHLLRDGGYATHLFHFEHESDDLTTLGFDQLHAMPPAPPADHMPHMYDHLPAGEVAEVFAAFCKAAPRRPFYAQVGFFETHSPLDFGSNSGDDSLGVWMPPQYADCDRNRTFFRMLQGSVRQVDAAIGRMLAALDETGLADDTIVVFTSDHGISTVRAKGTMYDQGMEVPLIVRWPGGGVAGGRTCDRLISNIDVTPTLLQLIGAEMPASVEGVGFARSLRGEGGDEPRGEVFSLIHGPMEGRCIRTERCKLIRSFEPVRLWDVPVDPGATRFATAPPVQLFDLDADPMESSNLAADPAHSATLDALDRRLLDHLRRVKDPVLEAPVRKPYYVEALASLPTG